MRLMLIDADTSALNALSRMLRFHAMDVTSSVEDAFALMRDGRRIDAVMCDVHLAGMDIPQFHAALAETRPDLAARVVYVTDGALRDGEAGFLEMHRTVSKPFDRADVERALMPFDPLPLL